MAYDDDLAERIREMLATELDVVEKRMFGGLAFLLGGHLAVAASGRGGLMVRVDPQRCDEFVAHDGVARMVMRGREMRGWLRVDDETVADDEELRVWITRGVDFVRTLPSK